MVFLYDREFTQDTTRKDVEITKRSGEELCNYGVYRDISSDYLSCLRRGVKFKNIKGGKIWKTFKWVKR